MVYFLLRIGVHEFNFFLGGVFMVDYSTLLIQHSSLDSDEDRKKHIEDMENFLISCNEGLARDRELTTDAIYDTVKFWLRELAPDSPVLKTVWSEDSEDECLTSYDRFLLEHPMVSIRTVKSLSSKDVKDFGDRLPDGKVWVLASLKENGHGIRLVYNHGKLVRAHSRGRASLGRNLLPQMTAILGAENPKLADYGMVEFRGEVVLPYSNLKKAKEFNPNIKSAFTGVSSMIRDSASVEETQLLRFRGYDVFTDEVEFSTLADKFNFIEEVGFDFPGCTLWEVSRDTLEDDLNNVMDYLYRTYIGTAEENGIGGTGYDDYTDGVVVAVNDLQLFKDFGQGEGFHYGNLALKIGFWEQNLYHGVIKHIAWKRGKNKLTPVAVVDGVLTAVGNVVKNITLYNPYNMLVLDAYPGNTIHFRYGGEAGVIPCTPDGRTVTEAGGAYFG